MAKDTTSGVSQHYMGARTAWDERYGDLISRAQNWRMAFFGMTAVALLSGGSLLFEMRRSHVVPFVRDGAGPAGQPRRKQGRVERCRRRSDCASQR